MATFSGGSAWSMAREIAGGYVLVTVRTLKALSPEQVNKLLFELDRRLREIRSQPADQGDPKALQERNRQLQRLTSARRTLEGGVRGIRG